MAAVTWTDGTGNWSNTADWSPAPPAAGDDVAIPGDFTFFFTATLDITSTPALDSLTLGTSGGMQLTIGANTLNVTGTGAGHTDSVTLNSSSELFIEGGTVNAASLILNDNGSEILFQGGTINANSLVLFNSNSFLFGFGIANGSISGAGFIEAGGGTLELTGSLTALTASTGTFFVIDSSSVLQVDGNISQSNNFSFFNNSNNSGVLGVGNDSGNASATVANMSVGTGLVPTDEIDIEGHTVSISSVTGQGTTSGTISLSDGAVLNLTNLSSTGWFANAVGDGASGTDIFVSDTACFCRGTLIRTPRGDVCVEDLGVGDRVVTWRDEVRPIIWIGTGRVLATRGQPSAATPVIVGRGAFADKVPYADLRVTKGHSFYVDGALIPVEYLVNHRSILWDDHAQEVSIYHIELATHEILLANGAPAESYRDDGNRWLFQNANLCWTDPPQAPVAPVLTGGPVVDAAWRRFMERAGPRPGVPLTDDADLHLLVDGQPVEAAQRHGDRHVFRLRRRPETVRIVSRAAAPQELGLARDPRMLGVALRRIVASQAARLRLIEADDALLVDGFHEFEPDNGFRWTDGDAAIPDVLFAGFTGAVELVLQIGCTARYLADNPVRRVA